jgi:hypothetical protein
MSDPRNVAHAKKVTQEKKHHGEDPQPAETAAAQTGKKRAKKLNTAADSNAAPPPADASAKASAASEAPAPQPSATLEGSLVVLGKLKDIEFHSRATLERLAELAMTVEDELKQSALAASVNDVYAAQSAFQTKVTALIEAYKAECDGMQPS